MSTSTRRRAGALGQHRDERLSRRVRTSRSANADRRAEQADVQRAVDQGPVWLGVSSSPWRSSSRPGARGSMLLMLGRSSYVADPVNPMVICPIRPRCQLVPRRGGIDLRQESPCALR